MPMDLQMWPYLRATYFSQRDGKYSLTLQLYLWPPPQCHISNARVQISLFSSLARALFLLLSHIYLLSLILVL